MITKFLRGVILDYQHCDKKDSCNICSANKKIPSTSSSYCELLREHGKIASSVIKDVIDKRL